ncbi:hypothetical protein KC867_01230 [Candidatus Saccharibacteria bacterium]|nr:hypothetical protein [Candidatus Saccharibacteria bacterium]
MKSVNTNAKTSDSREEWLFDNIRFYILLLALVLSMLIVSYTRTSIVSDGLFMIRTQQIYAFVAMGFWYLALLATPLVFVFGDTKLMNLYLFARLALGVSGTYFAGLHMLFGVFGQLGGWSGIMSLPDKFLQAVVLGVVAMTMLVVMAMTAFDRVIQKLTFRRWQWLQRLVYPAVVLALFHAWIIGTHLQYIWPRIIMLTLIGLLVVLETWRLSFGIERLSGVTDKGLRWTIFIAISLLFVGASVYVPMQIPRYHDEVHSGVHE